MNTCMGFPGGSHGNESAYIAGDLGSIPGSWKSPGMAPQSSILIWRISAELLCCASETITLSLIVYTSI